MAVFIPAGHLAGRPCGQDQSGAPAADLLPHPVRPHTPGGGPTLTASLDLPRVTERGEIPPPEVPTRPADAGGAVDCPLCVGPGELCSEHEAEADAGGETERDMMSLLAALLDRQSPLSHAQCLRIARTLRALAARASEAEKCAQAECDGWKHAGGLNHDLTYAAEARDAWRNYAEHAEFCVECGETSWRNCTEGRELREAAESADKLIDPGHGRESSRLREARAQTVDALRARCEKAEKIVEDIATTLLMLGSIDGEQGHFEAGVIDLEEMTTPAERERIEEDHQDALAAAVGWYAIRQDRTSAAEPTEVAR